MQDAGPAVIVTSNRQSFTKRPQSPKLTRDDAALRTHVTRHILSCPPPLPPRRSPPTHLLCQVSKEQGVTLLTAESGAPSIIIHNNRLTPEPVYANHSRSPSPAPPPLLSSTPPAPGPPAPPAHAPPAVIVQVHASPSTSDLIIMSSSSSTNTSLLSSSSSSTNTPLLSSSTKTSLSIPVTKPCLLSPVVQSSSEPVSPSLSSVSPVSPGVLSHGYSSDPTSPSPLVTRSLASLLSSEPTLHTSADTLQLQINKNRCNIHYF